MTALDFLKAFKNYIESEICSKTMLQSENGEEYVHPNCYIMHLPSTNFNPNGYNVPFIAVELDNADDDIDEHLLSIRMTFATYGGGYYLDDLETKTDIPDGDGYIDLLNLIEKTKQALFNNVTVDGYGTIRKPLNYGVYDIEVPFPYWYGFLKFNVNIQQDDFILDY